MITVGGAMSGYCEIGRIALATSPAITMTMAMTPASTGRSMKNFENMSVGRRGGTGGRLIGRCPLRHHSGARLQLHEVVEDHRVALVQPLANDPVLTDPVADLHGPLCRLAACIDGPHIAAEISLQHCGLRHSDDVLRTCCDVNRCELAGQDLQ